MTMSARTTRASAGPIGVATVSASVGQIAQRLGGDDQADTVRGGAKRRRRRARVAEFGERVVRQRMVDQVKRHGHIVLAAAYATAVRGSSIEFTGCAPDSLPSSWLLVPPWPPSSSRGRCRCSSTTASSSPWTRRNGSSRTAPWRSTAPTSSRWTPTRRFASSSAAPRSIDAGGQVIMPGLVNTHTHAPMVLLRGLADDLALQEWLTKYIFPAEGKIVSPEFVRVGHAAGRARDDRVGHDDLRGHVLLRGGDREGDEGRRAARRARADGHPVPGGRRQDAGRRRWRAPRRSSRQFKGDPLITPAVAPHAIYTLDGPTLKAARELSKRHGVPTLIHLAETRDEIQTARERFTTSPVSYLDSLGVPRPGRAWPRTASG